ncbi:hypothetical protein GCM10007079_01500 [Nocardiopsis terrae]|uniref:DUF2397 domain-containing protein n=1 Tax=Nocardiopsis terrae TaxID=372655 RepID=A0ABR9HMI1_9ACTN|nr:DUF2397 family protein [Nocardiopsis terrae]MBE1460202.1 hypothetical protein [Nocardiopsis terrae]GHC70245.1 hypothetical protein GCM10007079_01500 [Nocardiopsis terrae]
MGLNQRTDDRADDGQGTGDRPVPRHGRAALLRLATWFEEAEPDRADELAAAAFALHPARHIEGRVDDTVAATTSWWQAEPDRSTVTEHPGTRLPEPVRDHRAQQARLRDAAESSAHWRRAGAEQIRSLLTRPTGDHARLDLSGAGMEVLMELLTAALGSGDASRRPTSAGDLEFGLRLHVYAAPGAEVTVRGEGGDLTLEGLRLRVTSYEQHTLDTEPPSGNPTRHEEAPSAVAPVSAGNDPVGGPAPTGTLPGPETFAEPEPGATPEQEAAPQREATPDPFPEPETAPEPDPEPEPEPAQEPGADASPEPDTAPIRIPDAFREAETAPEPEPDAYPEPEPEPDQDRNQDPDTETTGPIEITTQTPWTRRWG